MGCVIIGYLVFSYGTGFFCMFGVGAGERWSRDEVFIAPITMAGVIAKNILRRMS